MPIVKQISVHKTPLKMLQYILNGDKNSDMKYATGLNCTGNIQDSYKEFKSVFEHFTGERFYKYSLGNSPDEKVNSKEKIRLHHYIQSFSPGEATPEEAHKIGIEWAKKVFGENRQVVVSTHIDKGHIHNHFAVAAIALDGKVWHSNKKSLERCRSISDEIAKEHGLSIIENPKKFKTAKSYTEWLADQSVNTASWKSKLKRDIDKIVVMPDVMSVDDIIKKLEELNYTITQNKYLSIKAPNQKKAIRSFRLGDGYSLEDLQYRIEHKEREMSLTAILKKYSGIQIEYALCLRKMQIAVFERKPETLKTSYYTLRKNADMLLFMSKNNINSIGDFERIVNERVEQYKNFQDKLSDIEKECDKVMQTISDIDEYNELFKKDVLDTNEKKRFKELNYVGLKGLNKQDINQFLERLNKLESERIEIEKECEICKKEKAEAQNAYQTYMYQTKDEYAQLLDEVRREREYAETVKEEIQENQVEQEEQAKRAERRQDENTEWHKR